MPIEREQYGSGVSDPYMSIPVSEFENLHEQIRIRGERIAQVEEQRDAYYQLSVRLQTDMRDRERELLRRIGELEVEVAGYRWGESNAAAEEQELLELFEVEDDDGGHEGSND